MSISSNVGKRLMWTVLKFIVAIIVISVIIYQVKFTPIPVNSHVVKRGSITAEVMGTGTLEARIQTTISPKISDRINKILVDQGDTVSVGDLLVQLDDDELSQQVAIAKASLEAEFAAIERLKIDKKRSIAIFEQSQKSYNRIKSLGKNKTITLDELDKATESLAVTSSDVSRAEAAITEARKEIVAAEKTLEYHHARLNDTNIKAPFDGLIVKRNREPGDVVVPGSSILTLISMDELWISAWVDETEMAKLKTKQKARIVFRSEPEKPYQGFVVRLGKEADRETREFIVDVRVLKLATNWAVGQRAEVFIEVAQKDNVILLPANMIVIKNNKTGVYINKNGSAHWQPIKTGLHNRDTLEILDGLNPDDVVIVPVNPKKKLNQGRRVSKP